MCGVENQVRGPAMRVVVTYLGRSAETICVPVFGTRLIGEQAVHSRLGAEVVIDPNYGLVVSVATLQAGVSKIVALEVEAPSRGSRDIGLREESQNIFPGGADAIRRDDVINKRTADKRSATWTTVGCRARSGGRWVINDESAIAEIHTAIGPWPDVGARCANGTNGKRYDFAPSLKAEEEKSLIP